MKFSYKFSNLLSTVYHKGDLIFSGDGTLLVSPVGNRITIFDLKNHKSFTLPVESKFNYTAIDLSPTGNFLIAVNEEGEAHLITMIHKIVIASYRFKKRIRSVKFSPDGKYIAFCKENNVFIFDVPNLNLGTYNPFAMKRIFRAATDETTILNWSSDSKLLAVGSKDTITHIYSLQKWMNFNYISLGSHSDSIVACYFEKNSYDISTLSRNGELCVWECSVEPEDLVLSQPINKRRKKHDSDSEDDIDPDKALERVDEQKDNVESIEKRDLPEQNDEEIDASQEIKRLSYKKLARHYLADEVRKENRNVILTSSAYHQALRILVVGFSNGTFFLYEMPEVTMIHSLSISRESITSIAFNNSGDWIALGCRNAGQLLVWEWQSETYVLKQQGHSNNMNCLAYSQDGQYIVTGSDDGKIKVWNTTSGFCSVTFHEHTATVAGVKFSHNRKFIISASLDGTVRAFDLTRYRNFKTFISPRPVQFCCVDIDSSDEFIVAGGQDVFEIFLWSVKLGRLLEILSGHEGPVVSLAFNPSPASTELASVSWDKTLKLWNAIENGSTHETIQLTADGLFVTYKPNGKEVAVATLDGQISFFDCRTATQVQSIEGRNDLGSGRLETDMITAKKTLKGKAFTTLCYSADGLCILAGGQSKNICIYNIEESVLLKKFEVTQNRSLDAVDDFINRRKLTEFGNLALVEERDENEGGNISLRLPGVRRGDMASRSIKPEIRIFSLQFSPTGLAWSAATTEGLLIYSTNMNLAFDPFELEIDITPENVKKSLKEEEYSKALLMAIKLNEKLLIQSVLEAIQYSDIEIIVTNLPEIYVEKVLKYISSELESTRHIQFYLHWIEVILTVHGPKLNTALQMPVFLNLEKNMQRKYDELSKICDFNQYTISYLEKMGDTMIVKSDPEDKINSDDDDLTMGMDIEELPIS